MATLKLGIIKVIFCYDKEKNKIEKIQRKDAMARFSKGDPVFIFEGKPSAVGEFMRDAEEYSKNSER